ncbi:MAG: hypothetical protein PVG22_09145 [Chromatiales bacterium]|jgi:hypothetical protein
MQLDSIPLSHITADFEALAARLLDAEAHNPAAIQDSNLSPRLLIEAMHKVLQLLDIVQTQGSSETPGEVADPPETEQDIHRLGDYGLNLLADLAAVAGRLGEDELSHELETLCLPFALWIARQDGELSTLEPIINAIAYQANTLREPSALEKLYAVTGEIQLATQPLLQQDLEKSNPGRPWRILLLNRAIIATRTHRPELIELAYDNLIRHLPEEASEFFRQGMQQMVALDYPQPVRQVVEKYYNLWSVDRTLH